METPTSNGGRENDSPSGLSQSSSNAPSANGYGPSTQIPKHVNNFSPYGSRRRSVGKQQFTMYNVRQINWKELVQVEVKLTNLPGYFNTWDVYRLVDAYGTVVKISLPEGSKHRGRNVAFVKFQPAPNTAFWEVDGALGSVGATLSDRNTPLTVQHPTLTGRMLPQHLSHRCSSMGFGFMMSDQEMMLMHEAVKQEVEMSLDLSRKRIIFNFQVAVSTTNGASDLRYYRLQVKFDKLSAIYRETTETSETWTIPVDSPPELFRKPTELDSSHHTGLSIWTEWEALMRQTDVVANSQALRLLPSGLRRDTAIVDIGRWTTYRVDFRRNDDSDSRLQNIRQVLSIYNVQVLQQVIKVIPRNDTDIWHVLDIEEALVASNTMDYSLQLMAMERECFKLSFETRYQLEVCLSHGYLNENNLTADFLRQLHRLDQDNRHRAVGVLEKAAILKRRFFDPMDLFSLHVSFTEVAATRKPPRHCTIARSATVTPTMIYFNTPSIEISNRVVRSFSNFSDRFLRVRFSDELGWGKILSNDSARNEEVYERVRQILRYGIMLGDRKYEFLAFGNSQFREHGAYFFAPTKDTSCQDLRDKLGDLFGRDKKHPAKYCARLGQNFSTTRGLSVSVTIRAYKDNSKEFLLPDIKRNGFIFTDGVGKISKFLAKMIAAEFKLPTDDAPAVFQFRLGGCKGVLAVDPNLPSHEVHVRLSQYKFAAIHNGLEIIRTSSYASSSLNRQIILVLSALGVPDEVFMGKMDSQLKALNVAMKDENVAVNELQKAVDCNQVTLMMAAMIQHGFMASQEPFMISLLGLWRSWTLKALKEKAKVSVEKGAFLLGTVDETATLRGHFYDNQPNAHDTMEQKVAKLPEVFCYVDWKRRGVYEPVEGVCILARNPSLHPGDIRVVRAVDVPQLHHIHNAVVLPQTGDRDVSNMCSGGDLDGDDYLLIWDSDLIPNEWNHPPMDFTPAMPRVLDRLVSVDDMTDFFVDYMKSDKLALIATTHLALADWSEDGVKDDKCKALAQLHSLAVDYPKSGVPVNIAPQFRKVRWPHFMEKRKTGYTSKKILGQLYDLVEREEFSPKYHNAFDQRILQPFRHSEALLKKVAEIKCRYDSQIKRIMAQHGIATEFEVWSGFVMKHKNEVKDYKFGEELGTLMEAVRTSFQEECEKEAGGRDPARLHTFVSAMYTVTAKQVQEAREQAESDPEILSDPVRAPLMSFPWLFMHELGSIASGRAEVNGDAHRVQGSQKRYHTTTILGQGENSGELKTAEGIVPLGGVFRAFSDERSGSMSDINSERGTSGHDDHVAMIDGNIRGRVHVEPQIRRDMQMRAWQGYDQGPGNDQADDKRKGSVDVSEAQGVQTADDALPAKSKESHPPVQPDHIKDGNLQGFVQVELDLSDSNGD